MKTDIEIARECKLAPIADVAAKVGIPAGCIEPYGRWIAKVPETLIDDKRVGKSRLILVTAITPTKAGIGKTTVSIGLALGLNRIGKRAVVALREPSLGPCFGLKGGAAGGGYAQVLPMEKINLHFTGDFHAITAAHNMIAALLDNYIYQHRNEGFALREKLWKRVLDVNDRNLREVITGIGAKTNGGVGESGFDITPASEIMAILCLSTSIDDLRRRIDNILLGFTIDGRPFRVKDMGVGGAITVLLLDAVHPNLVQTTEQTPAVVHGGPFANIAHGCNSVVATKLAMTFGDYVVTEAGFGADLGAEKFFDIKCRKAGLQPCLTVVVATTQGLKMHGDVPLDAIKEPNREGLVKGLDNLDRHIGNMKKFGQSVVVAFNRFATDTDEELELVGYAGQFGWRFGLASTWIGLGNAFIGSLMAWVILGRRTRIMTQFLGSATTDANGVKYIAYEDFDPVKTKIEKICKNIYGAATVTYSKTAETMIARIAELGMNHFPVCIAKTQFSFSADPTRYGVPQGFNIHIRDLVVNAGAEMIVAIAGDILRMPGLPKSPQAERIDYIDGHIEGLS